MDDKWCNTKRYGRDARRKTRELSPLAALARWSGNKRAKSYGLSAFLSRHKSFEYRNAVSIFFELYSDFISIGAVG